MSIQQMTSFVNLIPVAKQDFAVLHFMCCFRAALYREEGYKKIKAAFDMIQAALNK